MIRSALNPGHRTSLALLENGLAARATLNLYRRALAGTDVYLRPTSKGLRVISLDWEHCPSMIGVGAAGTNEDLLRVLPATSALVENAVVGYLAKRDNLARTSKEEQFALRCISHALANGLRLPGRDWLFVHQEWRLPTAAGRGKIDLLAIDVSARRLVVIECKATEAGTTRPDSAGHVAAEQARVYADVLFTHRAELYPYFADLARALGVLYDGPASLRSLRLDGERRPDTAVWWPGNPIQ